MAPVQARHATAPLQGLSWDDGAERRDWPTGREGRGRRRAGEWAPLAVALFWMLATFGAFWLSDLSDRVPNPDVLCAFVFGAVGLFALGYSAQILLNRPGRTTTTPPAQTTWVRRLVFLGAGYTVALSLLRLSALGATGPQDILNGLRDPAAGYLHKLDAYEQGIGQGDALVSLLTFLGVLGTVLAPLLVVYWRQLSAAARVAGIVGLSFDAAYYLYTGTLKGLGDTAILSAAGLLVVITAPRHSLTRRRAAVVIGGAIAAVFVGYLAFNQAARAESFGTSDLTRPSPALVDLVGPRAADGLTATAFYPTHGYLGLAYNLQEPFVWSQGLGSAPAIRLFLQETFGVDTSAHPSYPERTEYATGWPSDQYWSTIYPWLASDLTFPGAALFMAVVGWFFARVWLDVTRTRRILPLLIFAQLWILILYLPANNQLGMSPESVFGLITLLILYRASASRLVRV
ncbi:hypothetical protein [Micromonospora sp. CNB394]|uniref:hypothetical protein n=1 Tax=Micromonospora sp. CNB394 TaxID=1169151 RepID=UPI00037F556D|nr:hypothetical protein [Micromonospora sp. CNB394]